MKGTKRLPPMTNAFFCDTDHYYCVRIAERTLRHAEHLCEEAGIKETGGIIIGHYEDEHSAFVNELSNPPSDSIRRKADFFRGAKNLRKLLEKAHRRGDYYIGEWHFHPNSSPCPSSADKKQMHAFARTTEIKCSEPILIIFGGNKNHWTIDVMVFTANHEYHLFCQSVRRSAPIRNGKAGTQPLTGTISPGS